MYLVLYFCQQCFFLLLSCPFIQKMYRYRQTWMGKAILHEDQEWEVLGKSVWED